MIMSGAKESAERNEFSARLQLALKNADYPSDSPTRLAREFNLRFTGKPVTVHAARKWLVGEAIPTQEKLRLLATWLGVAADWLRFGDSAGEPGESGDMQPRFESADVRLLSELHDLDQYHQELAREFLRLLIRTAKRRS